MFSRILVGYFFFLSFHSFAETRFLKPFFVPYLQKLQTNSVTIHWETNCFMDSWLVWRKAHSNKLHTKRVTAPKVKTTLIQRLRQVTLDDLQENTQYEYQVKTCLGTSTPFYSFKTLEKNPQKYYFLAMSDAQHGHKTTTQVVKESVLKYGFDPKSDTRPAFAIFAGDLVQKGSSYLNWQQQWFKPLKPLLTHIPFYPAIGNHEQDHRLYFTYFNLPENGSPGYKEHWYSYDYGPVRYISLDTNADYRVQEQIRWLKKKLQEVAASPDLEFVVAYFHHPHKSEGWLSGETAYSGEIQEVLEQFSLDTKKPSIHLCGHTHGYSRGHSFKSRHTMINVAALGGAIDTWGDYAQKDYPEYVKSLAEFGWLKVEVDSNFGNPYMVFKRYGFGDDKNKRDTGLQDVYKIYRYAPRPTKPFVTQVSLDSYAEIKSLQLKTSPYLKIFGLYHLSTQVQISSAPDFKTLKYDRIYNNENWYFGQNQVTEKSLEGFTIKADLEPKGSYLRVRYRNSSLLWSEWSRVYFLAPFGTLG